MTQMRQKLFLFMVLMALILLLVLWVFQIGFLEKNYISSKQTGTENRAKELGEMIDENDSGISDFIKRTDEQLNTAIMIVSVQGVPVFLSRPLQNMVVMDCVKIFYQQSGVYSDYVSFSSIGQNYARTFYQLEDGRGLFLLSHVAEVSETVDFLKNQFFIITVVVILVAAAISVLFSDALSKPVTKLNGYASNLAKGDLNMPIVSSSKDEVGHLAKTLEFLRQKLKREDKLRKELIGNVSHELKTPLAIIRGFAETVRDITYKDQEKRDRQLGAIIDETNRLTKIVDDIMDYSQLQAGAVRYNYSAVDLTAVVSRICGLVGEHAGATGVELTQELDQATVVGDETKLSQVVFNLVANAYNHSVAGKSIKVSLKNSGGMVKFSVADSGQGIPESEIENIWERHYKFTPRNREERMGSGLGLAICKAILEAHKAQFGVISKEGEGSEFYFCLQTKG